jgi:hypothetical protein
VLAGDLAGVGGAVQRRQLMLGTLCLGLAAGCATVDSSGRPSLEFRRINADYDRTWEAALRTIAERGYVVRRADQQAGEIETDWKLTNPDFDATVMRSRLGDRYSNCGKPGLGQVYRTIETKLDLLLEPGPQGTTRLRVDAWFQTFRYSMFLSSSEKPLGATPCPSRGRLEDEIRVEIQVRAIAAQIERMRRGTP